MDKAKKKQIKRIISALVLVALVVFLAAMPLLAQQNVREDGPKASILSGTVTSGSISTQLIGGGTLKEADAVSVSVPSAVKLTEFLVSNGDYVTAGTAIAKADRVTVMEAITQVQETLEYLSEEIEAAADTDSEEKVSALAGGTVKILYAQEGVSVQETMLTYGALAVLSLDGLMAVDLETDSTLAVGSPVTLRFADETQAEGKVVKNLAGAMTITLEDQGYAVDTAVEVSAQDGTAVASGSLYIYSPWNATAYTGTVETVKVEVGESLDPGDTLLVLTDVGYSAAYRQLIGQRQVYEDLMLELFRMYQTEEITAPSDGVISGVDENSLQLLSGSGSEFVLCVLANAPNGDDVTLYTNYVAQLQAIGENGWELILDPQNVEILDYMDLTGLSLDPQNMTEQVLFDTTQVHGGITPIYELVEGAWSQVDSTDIHPGDKLLFAGDDQGTVVWILRVEKAQEMPPEIPEDPTEPSIPENPSEPTEPSVPVDPSEPTEPSVPADPGEPTEPSVPTDPSEPTEPSIPVDPSFPTEPSDPSEPIIPSDPTMPSEPGGTGTPTVPEGTTPGGTGGSYPSADGSWSGMTGMSGMGSMGTSGTYPQMEQEPAYELYALDMTQIAAVIPQTTMTMEITIDELDIRYLQPGMTAQVVIDALGGEKYTAAITHIGNTGTGNGGNSKYTVELTMDRGENMLVGMNATAKITISVTDQVLSIPADALVEVGNVTRVYTGYDEENETLVNPVTVEVGTSDGETVEILAGLTQGQTYYYAYYDTLELSNTPDFGGGGFMFGG